MLGKRSDQKGLWEADRLYLDYVGQDTFYGLLASLRGQLFSDDDFAEIYCPHNGRDSVPPSLLAGKIGLISDTNDVGDTTSANFAEVTHAATNLGAIRLGQRWSLTFLTSALLPKIFYSTRAFRPDF